MDQPISLKGGKAVFLLGVEITRREEAVKDGTRYTKGILPGRGFTDVICGVRKHDWARCFMDGSGTFISPCLFDFDQADINCLVELRSEARWKAMPSLHLAVDS